MAKILDLNRVYFFRWQIPSNSLLNNKIFFGSYDNIAPPVFSDYNTASNFLNTCQNLTQGFKDLIIDKINFYDFKKELLNQLNLIAIYVVYNPTINNSGIKGEKVLVAKVVGIDL